MDQKVLEQTRNVIGDVLKIGERAQTMTAETLLFGAVPELDSMAVVELIITLEDHFDIFFEDDEVTAEMFDSVGSLVAALAEKIKLS